MLEQSDYRVLPGAGEAFAQSIPARVGHATGVALVPYAQGAWSGRSVGKSWNTSLLVSVQMMPAPGGMGVQITTGAEVDQNGWIILIVLLVFFWPAALLVGYLGYDDFNKRRQVIHQQIWAQLGAPAMPGPYGVR
jgi:hypothetical protein